MQSSSLHGRSHRAPQNRAPPHLALILSSLLVLSIIAFAIVTVKVNVDNLNFLLRLTSSTKIGQTVVPYLLLAFGSAILVGAASLLMLRKNKQFGLALLVVLGMMGFFLPLFIF
jgi:hypothetical protein